MIIIKNPEQIEKMRIAGKKLYEILCELREMIAPGVTTRKLDAYAEELILKSGAQPSFKGYNGYPASLCTSVNDVVVHGIPNDIKLKSGDIISIDAGLVFDGWQADSAFTAPVGDCKPEALQLISVTENCFWAGVAQAVAGARLGDVSNAIQTLAEENGCGVVRALCGHGIGQDMHEDPQVPNYGQPGRGPKLQAGMALAVEPMITAGTWQVTMDTDGWTVRTQDGSLCAHYEHTIAVLPQGAPDILTLPDTSLWRI